MMDVIGNACILHMKLVLIFMLGILAFKLALLHRDFYVSSVLRFAVMFLLEFLNVLPLCKVSPRLRLAGQYGVGTLVS